MEEEQKSLRAGMNILVGTPGRILQHMEECHGFEYGTTQVLVLDEADRILDLGFADQVKQILEHLPPPSQGRQTLLFSATLRPTNLQSLASMALRQPQVISVHSESETATPSKLVQYVSIVPLEKKVQTLFSFLRAHSQKKTIVFCSSSKQVRWFFEVFKRLKPGPSCMELNGKHSYRKRMLTFQLFSERPRAVCLLCTDVASRGVDFPDVDWVVQVDCPDSVDSYIHRVGRTARFESRGNSLLMLLPSERAGFLSRLTEKKISVIERSMKASQMLNIENQVSSISACMPEVKHLAQKAFLSYLKSYELQPDKLV